MVDIRIKINSTLHFFIITLVNLQGTNAESCNQGFIGHGRIYEKTCDQYILNCRNVTKDIFEFYNTSPLYCYDNYCYILSITNSNISSIDNSTLRGLCQLYEVTMTNSNIQNIQPNTFTDFVQIRKLDLENNKITKVNFLQGLSNLIELNLKHNILKQMETTDFVQPNQLHILNLAFNKLEFIDNKVFATLNKLTDLSLTKNNNLKNVDEAAFKALKNLTNLDLGYNKITTLQVKVFEGLSSLQVLMMNNNYLVEILVGIFNGLEKLQRLDLAHNKICTLNSSLFLQLLSLKILKLSNNNLVNISANTFSNLQKLEALDLTNNKISSLNSEPFSGLSSLKILKLNNNNLVNISVDSFHDLKYLEQLDLANNKILSLNPELFSGLKCLENLLLGNNMIKEIPLGTLKHFPKLKELHLGSNYLSQFKIGSFSNLRELQHLNLSHNNFSVLNEIVLYPLNNLSIMDLDSNNFSYINYTSLLLHLPSLQFISVNDNNWNCNLLTDMLRVFRVKGINYLFNATSRHNEENVDGVYCIETDQNFSKFSNISTPQAQAGLLDVVKNATDILLNAINENIKATRNISFDHFTKNSFLQMQADYTRDFLKNTSKTLIRESMDLLLHNMTQYLQNSENRNMSIISNNSDLKNSSNFGLYMISTLIFLSSLTTSFLLSFIVYKKYFKNVRNSRTKQARSEIELLSATS